MTRLGRYRRQPTTKAKKTQTVATVIKPTVTDTEVKRTTKQIATDTKKRRAARTKEGILSE
jgi:hypothetical protein